VAGKKATRVVWKSTGGALPECQRFGRTSPESRAQAASYVRSIATTVYDYSSAKSSSSQ